MTEKNKFPEPKISPSAHLPKDAIIVGDVTIGEECTVLYYSVLRGDNAPINIGHRTNIQDHCILHTDHAHPIHIGNNVTVGHGCILHGCNIGKETMIGMGSIVMNGAKIGSHCIVGAGSLVTENTVIPDGYLALGRPAKPIRPLRPEQLDMIRASAAGYVETGRKLFG